MPDPEIKKPKNWVDSLGYCIEGIILGFKTEKHIRYHFVIAIVALIVSLIFKLPAFEFALLAVSIVILLFAEMVNTALEEVVNLLEENYNVRAKNAKDLAAGAVLVSSAALTIVVFIIFSRYIWLLASQLFSSMNSCPCSIKLSLLGGFCHSSIMHLAKSVSLSDLKNITVELSK